MPRSFAFLRTRPGRSFLGPFALSIVFLAACGDDSTGGSAGDAAASDTETAAPDSGTAAQDSGTVAFDSGGARDSAIQDANHPTNPLGIGPTPVVLGSTSNLAAPGSYVLLAKTGITNVTGSLITGGHVGLSPAAATFITGFSLIADSTNVFSTSASVAAPGEVFASDYAVPTPANLTSAIAAMQLAYTDAAGRTNPDALDLGAGNIGGRTLVPGLYKWDTGVTIPGNVTFAGGANDVWILQIANDLDLSSATSVILAGDARASSIFWQVAGQATIHANAHFQGIILSQTSITLQTDASMHGRALSQTLVALDSNAVTAP
jgi:Ice-binding-like